MPPDSLPHGPVIDAARLDAEVAARRQAEQRIVELEAALEWTRKEFEAFAYASSHDLKEPLRGISNYASFLKADYAGVLDDEGHRLVDTIGLLARRMESLIESLLRYSRMSRGELDREEVPLGVLVTSVLEILRPTLDPTGVEIVVGPLPTVQCDVPRVTELFTNLITNAVKYNDKPQKRVEIGTAPGEPGGPPVFFVRDNGIGIPEKHHDSVFRIFKRLHGRDKYGGGTGAGLTIVKSIIQSHGGRIWLASTVGEGTTFYFTLEGGHEHA